VGIQDQVVFLLEVSESLYTLSTLEQIRKLLQLFCSRNCSVWGHKVV
jgi:hypothetical protein